jgi:hypothetical protein
MAWGRPDLEMCGDVIMLDGTQVHQLQLINQLIHELHWLN